MSTVDNPIKCTKCNFRSSSDVIIGRMMYHDGENSYAINSAYAWCYDCKTIVPMESFPKIEDIKEKLEKVSEKITYFENARFFEKFKAGYRSVKNSIDYYYSQESEYRWFINFLEDRKSPPRCLRCGSTEAKKMNIPHIGRYNEGPKQIKLDFKHPLCGGDLYIEDGTISNFYSFGNGLHYNAEGIRVHKPE